MNYSEILEGLLFLSGDDGMSEDEIKKILEIDNIDDIVSSLMNLQQKIYKSRCESVLIPDWFYSLQKRKYQKTEDRIARKISNS